MSESPAGKRSWVLVLFGLPFAAAGIGMLFWLLLPVLLEWHAMKDWVPVTAEMLAAELESHQGDDSTTYKATARYQYAYQGRTYVGDRVGLSRGSDNVGDWQQRTASRLQHAMHYHQPVTVYVNPGNPAKAIIDRELRTGMLLFYLAFVLVFSGVGIGIMLFGLKKRHTGTGVTDSQQPWLSRTEWSSPELTTSPKAGVWAMWGFAAFWCALSAPATFAMMDELEKGNWAILVILLFDVIGVFLVVSAIRYTLAAKRFGTTVLRLDPHPGSVGGQVGGCVAARVPFDEAQAFSVKLSCIHTYTRGSGKNRNTHHETLWQDERFFHAQPSADGMSAVWFCFDVPAGLPVSEGASSDFHHWQLQAGAEIPGIDFGVDWDIPVFATGKASVEASRQCRESQEEILEALDELMQLRQVPGGISLDYRAGRHWLSAVILLLVGAVFTAVAVFMGRSLGGIGETVIAGMMGLFGPALLLGGVWQGLNRLRVHIDHSTASIRYSLLGVPVYWHELPLAEVQGLRVVKGSRVQSGNDITQYYSLKLEHRDGKRYGIGDGFEGISQAQKAAEAISALTRVPVSADTL